MSRSTTFSKLAITELDEFVFGRCPRPLTTPSGLVIGNGTVYPELNFTLPSMQITKETMAEVRAIYSRIIDDACRRAVQLHVPGLVVEFELLPELTREPSWGAEVTAILRETLDRLAGAARLRDAADERGFGARHRGSTPPPRSVQRLRRPPRSAGLRAPA